MDAVTREIMEYVKVKDRPSVLELRVRVLDGAAYNTRLTITAPIENGESVWKVVQNIDTEDGPDICYTSSQPVKVFVRATMHASRRKDRKLEVGRPESPTALIRYAITSRGKMDWESSVNEALSLLTTVGGSK